MHIYTATKERTEKNEYATMLRTSQNKRRFDKDLVVITEHITKNYKGTTIIMPTGEIILWMPDIPKTSVALGTLSHEVFHITKYILKDIQCIPLNDDTEEIYATTLGRIIELITNKLNPSII